MLKCRTVVLGVLTVAMLAIASAAGRAEPGTATRAGRVQVVEHALQDEGGPFLGLGVSYFTALWRCKHDRGRLEADLDFLSKQGFNYYRMLSMVGYQPSWEGKEVAPVAFTSRQGKWVPVWPDYWEQLRTLIDLAYDKYGLRTQITIFADAQLMPEKADRIDHLRRLLSEVVAGREHKVMLLEVANEAWQNGFPEEQGVADLQEFAGYLAERTEVPVAISSNHDWPAPGGLVAFKKLYAGSAADVATWHFSRDRQPDEGWLPVYDCWEYGNLDGLPPVSSNEPIGPGASVNAERDPLKLVMAAAFAYTAKLPMYVYHSEAGVMGRGRFQEMPGIERFGPVLKLLPADLANWERFEALDAAAPFTTFAGGEPNRLWLENKTTTDGCIRNCGSRSGNRFVAVPIGIQPGGLRLAARHDLRLGAYNLLTGERLIDAALRDGERNTLPQESGSLLILGEIDSHLPERAP